MREFTTAGGPGRRLECLDGPSVAAVHEASMEILEDFGIQLGHSRARELVETHGGAVDENDVATLPRGLVVDAIEAAPASFTLHARNPDNNVTVGGDGPPVRAPGYGARTVYSAVDGRRDARLADYEALAKLVQTTDALTCSGYKLCEPSDVDADGRALELLKRSLTLTDKPVMGPTDGSERAQACLDAVGIVMGDSTLSKPMVAGLINTVPPRSIDTGMLGGLMTYAEHGQPLVVSSFTMAGASGPPTLGATMAQANAENLAAITLAQLVNPGTPVVYGVPSATVDDRYGSLSIGNPESALFTTFADQMARYYGLPSRGGGALSDAKRVDYQSGFESALVGAVTAFSGVDFVLNAAGILESYAAISPEKFVLDCEILRSLDRFQRGVSVDGDTISLECIADTEPGGHFLDTPSGSTFYRSMVVDKRAHVEWAANGHRSTFDLAHERVQGLLDAYERPPMDEAVSRELDEYVSAHSAP